MKIAIAGSGAMGSTYGIMLQKAGNEVVFLDKWEENVKNINEKGITFENLGNTETIKAKAYFPREYKEKVDLVIVFTKSMQLEMMLEDIKDILSEDTKVMCLLNGLGHWDTLKKFVKEENIIMGVTVLTAGIKGPGHFSCSSFGLTELRDLTGKSEAMVKEIVDMFNNAKLPANYSENIMFSIWKKACLNGVANTLCTILNANMLEVGKVDKIENVVENIVSEFSLVAKKFDVTLDVKEITKIIMWFMSEEFKGCRHYPSMYQDLIIQKRYTEIDYLNGYVSKKGKELNIETKYCDLITTLVHGKEKILIGE